MLLKSTELLNVRNLDTVRQCTSVEWWQYDVLGILMAMRRHIMKNDSHYTVCVWTVVTQVSIGKNLLNVNAVLMSDEIDLTTGATCLRLLLTCLVNLVIHIMHSDTSLY